MDERFENEVAVNDVNFSKGEFNSVCVECSKTVHGQYAVKRVKENHKINRIKRQ